MVTEEKYLSNADRILEGINHLDFGDQITYAELSRIAGYDVQRNRSAFYTANMRLLNEKRRFLENVPGVGYCVIAAEDHLNAARKRHRGARRKMKASVAILAKADRTGMLHDVQRRLDAAEQSQRSQLAAMSRFEAKQKEHDEAIKELRTRSKKTTQATTDHEERLARLERLLEREELSKAA